MIAFRRWAVLAKLVLGSAKEVEVLVVDRVLVVVHQHPDLLQFLLCHLARGLAMAVSATCRRRMVEEGVMVQLVLLLEEGVVSVRLDPPVVVVVWEGLGEP